MGCKGTFTGTRFQLVTSGAAVGEPLVETDTYVAGDMVTFSDGRICWPYVSMTWSLSEAVAYGGSTASTTSLSFACMSSGSGSNSTSGNTVSSSAATSVAAATTVAVEATTSATAIASTLITSIRSSSTQAAAEDSETQSEVTVPVTATVVPIESATEVVSSTAAASETEVVVAPVESVSEVISSTTAPVESSTEAISTASTPVEATTLATPTAVSSGWAFPTGSRPSHSHRGSVRPSASASPGYGSESKSGCGSSQKHQI